jgi:hypothetical protein
MLDTDLMATDQWRREKIVMFLPHNSSQMKNIRVMSSPKIAYPHWNQQGDS